MKKNTGWIITVVAISLILIFSMVFGSAGGFTSSQSNTPLAIEAVATATAIPTLTPDPCSPAGIPEQVTRVHVLTREFEDTAMLLTTTILGTTSVSLVKDLQRVRREAEDQVVPSCLDDLKAYQIAHMNARIEVFGVALAFFNQFGSTGDPLMPDGVTKKQDILNQSLAPLWPKEQEAARQYETEYYRLLGVTPTPAPTVAVTATP